MDGKSTTADENNQDTDSQATDQQTGNDADNLDTSNQDQNQSDDANNNDSTDEETDTPATFDDDLDDWMEKRKLPKAENDEQKQAYQDLRNSQREFTREQQAKKDAAALNKDLKDQREELNPSQDDDEEEDDELEKTVKELKADRDLERTTRLQSEFYTENKVSDAEHKAILDIIKEKVAKAASKEGKLRALDIWGSTDALPDLLDLAKARASKSTDPSLAEEAARKAERDRIAKESNANSTNRGAKTVTTGDKTPEQQRLERFSDW